MLKKRTLIIIVLTCFNTLINAQTAYYYYNNVKTPLVQRTDKVSVFMPKGVVLTPPKTSEHYELSNSSFSDDMYSIYTATFKDPTKIDNVTLLQSKLATKSGSAIIAPIYQDDIFDELFLTPYINVKLKTGSQETTLYSLVNKYNLSVVEKHTLLPLWYTLRVTPQTGKNALEIANILFETGVFASSAPDFSFDGLECVSDPDFSQQWNLKNSAYADIDISACEAWTISKGKGVTIAIIDQGVELSHSDLSANIAGLSFDVETSSSPSRVRGDHGTHCAGIAAAVSNNGKFISGVAPEAKILSISISFSGTKANEKLAKGIAWAWQHGADIISCSWQAPKSDILKNAIDIALTEGRNGKGCVIVKSAGNQSGGAVTFPGDYRPEILTVSSIDIDGNFSSFSSKGNAVDVCAPGRNILSTVSGNTTALKNGTSMACPHVSGVAALLLAKNPYLTGQEVRDIIEKTAKKVGNTSYNTTSSRPNGTWNNKYGYGLVDAYNAVLNACTSVTFENKTITADTEVDGCQIDVQNINVKQGAKLKISAQESIDILESFEVEEGAELEIVIQ